MAAVEPVTLSTHARLLKDPAVAETALVMNEGGHFRDVPGRLANAVQWLMKP